MTTNPNPPTPTPARHLRHTADRLANITSGERELSRDGEAYLDRQAIADVDLGASALRTLADLVDADPLGIDWCTLHLGVRNEDARRCDMADGYGADRDGRPCTLVPLVVRPADLVS